MRKLIVVASLALVGFAFTLTGCGGEPSAEEQAVKAAEEQAAKPAKKSKAAPPADADAERRQYEEEMRAKTEAAAGATEGAEPRPE